jgi:hypothetical protein
MDPRIHSNGARKKEQVNTDREELSARQKKKRELKLSQWFPSEGLTQTHLGQQNTH